jgi:hypothetical protein
LVRFFTVCAYIRSHCTSCALAVQFFDVTSCHSTRSNQKTSQGFPLDPPWCAPKLLTLPRHQCFGGVEQIQILRSHFDTKMRTRKWHAPCDCNFFCQLLRTLVRTNFKQKRDSTKFCQVLAGTNNPTAATPPSLPREFQEGTSWRPSWPLLGARQEVALKQQTANAHEVQCERMAVQTLKKSQPPPCTPPPNML